MGLISIISRLGKDDCVEPCGSIDCGAITTCTDLRDCLEATFDGDDWFTGVDMEFEVDGVVNGTCAQCDSFNNSHILPTGTFFDPPDGCSFSTRPIETGGACSGLADLAVALLGLDLDSIVLRLGGGIDSTATFGITDPVDGPAAIAAFCAGEDVELPLTATTPGTECDFSGTTVTWRKLP